MEVPLNSMYHVKCPFCPLKRVGGQNCVTFDLRSCWMPTKVGEKTCIYFFLNGRQYDLYVFSSCFFVIFARACDVKLSKSFLAFLVNFSPFPIWPVSAYILLGNLNTRQLTVKSGQTYSPMWNLEKRRSIELIFSYAILVHILAILEFLRLQHHPKYVGLNCHLSTFLSLKGY